jgi:hypothetical protein
MWHIWPASQMCSSCFTDSDRVRQNLSKDQNAPHEPHTTRDKLRRGTTCSCCVRVQINHTTSSLRCMHVAVAAWAACLLGVRSKPARVTSRARSQCDRKTWNLDLDLMSTCKLMQNIRFHPLSAHARTPNRTEPNTRTSIVSLMLDS